jgi:hypothetical protein
VTYQSRYTKTFIHRRWYRRQESSDLPTWTELATSETPLDEQITAFVQGTGAVIIHPGQLGIHSQWQNEEMTLKEVTLGITVLYIDGSSSHGRVRHGQGTAAIASRRPGQDDCADPTGGAGDPGANTVEPGVGTVTEPSPITATTVEYPPTYGAASDAGATPAADSAPAADAPAADAPAADAPAADAGGTATSGGSGDFSSTSVPRKRRRPGSAPTTRLNPLDDSAL